jgi:putative addiction module component (TIGR02574 family)
MAKPALDIDTMSRDERLELLEELWDSLIGEAETMPLTAEQRVEFDRRLDALDREGDTGISAEELRARLRRDPS